MDLQKIKLEILKESNKNIGVDCRWIMRALPEQFGDRIIQDQLMRDADKYPTMVAKLDGDIIGFLTYKELLPESVEMCTIGVLPQYHKQGIGNYMQDTMLSHLKSEGYKIVQIKLVAADYSTLDLGWARRLGFSPLELHPNWCWRANTNGCNCRYPHGTIPCLIIAKTL